MSSDSIYNIDLRYLLAHDYRQIFNTCHALVGVKFVDHSDVVGASPAGAAPTPSTFSTQHMAQWIGQRQLQDEKETFKFGDLERLTWLTWLVGEVAGPTEMQWWIFKIMLLGSRNTAGLSTDVVASVYTADGIDGIGTILNSVLSDG